MGWEAARLNDSGWGMRGGEGEHALGNWGSTLNRIPSALTS